MTSINTKSRADYRAEASNELGEHAADDPLTPEEVQVLRRGIIETS